MDPRLWTSAGNAPDRDFPKSVRAAHPSVKVYLTLREYENRLRAMLPSLPDRWRTPTVQKALLALVVASFIVLAVAYNLLQPAWEAPDEADHFAFARFIILHHTLPSGTQDWPAHIDAWNPVSEFNQLPLFYLVEAAAIAPIPLPDGAQFHPNPFVAWPNHPWAEAVALHRTDEGWPFHGLVLALHLGRLVALGFGIVTLLATYFLVETFARRPFTALFATAWLAWTPSFILGAARVDNDAAAAAASALTILVSARLLTSRRANWLSLAILSLCVTGAVLSKLNDVFLITVVGLTAYYAGAPKQPRRAALARRISAVVLVLALPVSLLAGWWLLVGQTFQGRVATSVGFGVLQFAELLQPAAWPGVLDAVSTLNGTWWGGVGFGGLLLWPPVVYLGLAIPLVLLLGLGLARLRQPDWQKGSGTERWTVALLFVSTLPLVYATIARQAMPSVGLDANARFLLPVTPVVALLVALGAERAPLGRLRAPVGVGYLAGLLALATLTATMLLPRIPAPTIPARLARAPAELSQPARASFPNGVDLLAVHGLPATLTPGQTLPVQLLWRVATPPTENFIVSTQLIDRASSQKVASPPDGIPFERSFPPTMWGSGEFVEQPDQLTLPPNLSPGSYDLQVALYVRQGQETRPIYPDGAPEERAVAIAHWTVLPDATGEGAAQPVNARFGADLQLAAYQLRPTANGVQATLYWTANQQLPRNLTVSVQLLDASGKLVAQQDGEPVNGRLPTSAWPVGAVVRDDHLVALKTLPAGVHVVIVVYDHQTLQRLPVSFGASVTKDYLDLGPVALSETRDSGTGAGRQ